MGWGDQLLTRRKIEDYKQPGVLQRTFVAFDNYTSRSLAGISSVLGEPSRSVVVMDIYTKDEFVVLIVEQYFGDSVGLKRRRKKRV